MTRRTRKPTEQEKAEQLRRTAQAQAASAYTTPEFESSTAAAIYGGLASTIRQAPGIAASILTGNPAPALAGIGLQTQAEAYGKYRARGASPGAALAGGAAEGAVAGNWSEGAPKAVGNPRARPRASVSGARRMGGRG